MAKKICYIGAFTALGVLLQFLVHAGLEMWYVWFLLRDFEQYGLGLTWNQWVHVHDVAAAILLVGGAGAGYGEGVYWFSRVYRNGNASERDAHNNTAHYFELAAVQARKATCLRARCGSVIVKNGTIIGMGHNSPPQNREDRRTCRDMSAGGKTGYDRTCCVHAEWRAIMDALRNNPKAMTDSRLYFIRVDGTGAIKRSGNPYCTVCSRLALDSGITEFALWHDIGITVYKTPEYDALSHAYKEDGDARAQTSLDARAPTADSAVKPPEEGLVSYEASDKSSGGVQQGIVTMQLSRASSGPPSGLPIDDEAPVENDGNHINKAS